jgi:nucleoside-diphosphate-sugar epimerase
MSFSGRKPVVLVTGLSGFIGGFLARYLVAQGFGVVGTCRLRSRLSPDLLKACTRIHELEIDDKTDWSAPLSGVEFVVHAAAHVHVRRPKSTDLDLFRAVNVDGLRRFADFSRDAPVSLFVNLSSIAAEFDSRGSRPTAYGESKKRGEEVLAEVLGTSECRYLSLRLPAVYGPGMKGGLKWLYGVVKTGLPLPIIGDSPARSYLSVWNLADCVFDCLASEQPLNVSVAIADCETLDMQALIEVIAAASGKQARGVRVSFRTVSFMSRMLGKRQEFERAMTPASVDAQEAARILGWTAPFSAAESWRRVSMAASDAH